MQTVTPEAPRAPIHLLLAALAFFGAGCDSNSLGDPSVEDASPDSIMADARPDGPAVDGGAVPDAAIPDAAVPDAAVPDAAAPDAAAPDAGEIPADFCEAAGAIVMEAEAFSAQFGYAEVPRDDASGGVAMQVGDTGVLSFEIFLETAGTWYFWPRTLAPDSESNGMHVEIDGVFMTAPASNPYAGADDIYLQKSSTQWFWEPKWQGPGSGQVAGPVTFELAAGVHTLSIHKRIIERPLIDRIVLTTTNVAPTGLGPSETLCR